MTQKEQLLESLKGGPVVKKELLDTVSKKTNADANNVRRRLNELVDGGKVKRYKLDDGSVAYVLQTPDEPLPEDHAVFGSPEKLQEYLLGLATVQQYEQELHRVDKRASIDVPETGYFGVVLGSDWHIGAIYTRHQVLYRECDIIANTPGLYYGFLGDIGDFGSISRHQGIKHEQIVSPAMQREIALALSKILSPSMLFMISGCHDYWAKDVADYDFVAAAARISKVPYLGGGNKFYLQADGGAVYCGVAHHKVTGYSQYNDCHPCVKRALFHEQEADFIAIGHTHVVASGKQIVGERMRYMCRTAARKEWDWFAAKLGPDQKRENMDVPVLILHGSRKEGEWVHGIEKAACFLTALRATE